MEIEILKDPILSDVTKFHKLGKTHESHHGISKTNSLARLYVWWPSLEADIEKLVLSYTRCQLHKRKNHPKEPISHWNKISFAMERLHIDFAGPINENVIVDVPLMADTTSRIIICILRSVFSRTGIPESLVSDNGPQFSSAEFKIFLDQNNILHIRLAPYHPATNGLVERFSILFRSTKFSSLVHKRTLLDHRDVSLGHDVWTVCQTLQVKDIGNFKNCQCWVDTRHEYVSEDLCTIIKYHTDVPIVRSRKWVIWGSRHFPGEVDIPPKNGEDATKLAVYSGIASWNKDINNDLIVTSPTSKWLDLPEVGHVHLFINTKSDIPFSSESIIIRGLPIAHSFFGWNAEVIDDLDGDGLNDFLIAALKVSEEDLKGGIYVFLGGNESVIRGLTYYEVRPPDQFRLFDPVQVLRTNLQDLVFSSARKWF
ncbi:hypothetical protein RF11_03059 [Thelohanellus kitauei]|uniref:Integrase catalytic domain-containing protein n=1 Tax=Thelohanellus kitauei TaxID=669202 RepID=A0A0C2JHR4_THEKT|nr:hypothetical protein RF11_03059 [Thelohanellus kitauei]